VRDDVLVSCLGEVTDRDALAQAADRLLDLEGVSVTFVFGFTGVDEDSVVYASARARGTDLDLGEALRDAFAQVGSAGGHADMAGAQLPVGMLIDEEDEDPEAAIDEVVTERFFETLGVRPNRAAAAVYAQGDYFGTGGEYRPEGSGDGRGPSADGHGSAGDASTGAEEGPGPGE
jgi:hypothetical protein